MYIDLVREQFRMARGEEIGYSDPQLRGHSFEFRINGEDAGRGFMPAPGTISTLHLPTGPGVRVDSGVEQGETVSGNFDSMIAKLIVTGATRNEAAGRARRALDEMVVEGMPTVIPFHRAVMADPAFVPTTGAFTVHTRWIETEYENTIEPWSPSGAATENPDERQKVTVEVGGKRLEVILPAGLGGSSGSAKSNGKSKRKRTNRSGSGSTTTGDSLTSPMQGTIVKVAVADGDIVAEGDLVVVLEAMKMEQPLTAHRAGTIKGLTATAGETVSAGAVLASILD